MQDKELLIADLRDALSKMKALSGLLPVCPGWRKIRDEDREWHDVDTYLSAHGKADFSHGLCSHCAEPIDPDGFGPQGSVSAAARR